MSRAGTDSTSGSRFRSRIWPRCAGSVTCSIRWSIARVRSALACWTCRIVRRASTAARHTTNAPNSAASRRSGGRFTGRSPLPRPRPDRAARSARGGNGCRRGDACRAERPNRRSGRGRTGWPRGGRGRRAPRRDLPRAAPPRGRGRTPGRRARSGSPPRSGGTPPPPRPPRRSPPGVGGRPPCRSCARGATASAAEGPGTSPGRSRGHLLGVAELGRAEPGAPGPRVPDHLLFGGAERLAGEDLEPRLLAERALHDPVLERVIRDRDNAATGSEDAHRSRQGSGELLELPVDRDAERLEGSARGVRPSPAPAHGTRDHAGEPIRRPDRLPRTGPDDRGGHPTGPPLLAELENQTAELLLGELVHE